MASKASQGFSERMPFNFHNVIFKRPNATRCLHEKLQVATVWLCGPEMNLFPKGQIQALAASQRLDRVLAGLLVGRNALSAWMAPWGDPGHIGEGISWAP
jgi:hypothetical protein